MWDLLPLPFWLLFFCRMKCETRDPVVLECKSLVIFLMAGVLGAKAINCGPSSTAKCVFRFRVAYPHPELIRYTYNGWYEIHIQVCTPRGYATHQSCPAKVLIACKCLFVPGLQLNYWLPISKKMPVLFIWVLNQTNPVVPFRHLPLPSAYCPNILYFIPSKLMSGDDKMDTPCIINMHIVHMIQHLVLLVAVNQAIVPLL